MEQSSPELKLSPVRLKRFFLHCAAAARKVSEKQRMKSELSQRIGKLRELSLMQRPSEKGGSRIAEELEKLEKKISEVIDMQLKEKTSREALMHKLEEKIEAVQPKPSAKPLEDFERISARLSENAQKLSMIGEHEQALERKFESEKSGLEKIESQLRLLEKRHISLKNKKGIKKEDLARLKSMIEKHKKTIREIKSQ